MLLLCATDSPEPSANTVGERADYLPLNQPRQIGFVRVKILLFLAKRRAKLRFFGGWGRVVVVVVVVVVVEF